MKHFVREIYSYTLCCLPLLWIPFFQTFLQCCNITEWLHMSKCLILFSIQPCHEVKRSFLAGCDIIVDKSLQHCLHLVEILQNQMKALTEQCQNDNNNNVCLSKCFLTASILLMTLLQILQQRFGWFKMSHDCKFDSDSSWVVHALLSSSD